LYWKPVDWRMISGWKFWFKENLKININNNFTGKIWTG
jgi:hypothetical protein